MGTKYNYLHFQCENCCLNVPFWSDGKFYLPWLPSYLTIVVTSTRRYWCHETTDIVNVTKVTLNLLNVQVSVVYSIDLADTIARETSRILCRPGSNH